MVAVAEYITATDAAKIIGCSRSSVCRAAKNYEAGVFANGRLAAISRSDIEVLKDKIHKTSGNPNWIAARGQKLGRKKKRKQGI
jgi:hypothetical protein